MDGGKDLIVCSFGDEYISKDNNVVELAAERLGCEYENFAFDDASNNYIQYEITKRAIQFENRKLFDNLYAQLESTEEGRFIINHVKRNYPELNVAGDAFKNEVLTYSLQWKAVDKVTEEVESEGFLAFISKLLFAIRQLFRKVFETSKVSGINESTTMEELADAFLNENFDLETDLIKNDDIVFFVKNIKDMASDLTKGIASNTLQQSLNELYIGNNLILNKAKNYRSQTPYFKEMLDRTIFREGSNVLLPKAQEILRSYQTVSTLNKNASKEDTNYKCKQRVISRMYVALRAL